MKVKDYVTLGNLACGFAAVVSLMLDDANFSLACFLIIAGFVFDVSDGIVARLMKQHDKFGGELDNLCDLITYSVAPGFVVFHAFYHQAGWPVLSAAFLGFLLPAIGTIRAARYNVRRLEYPGFFVGLPRPAVAILVVSLLQSSLFRFLGTTVSEYFFFIPATMIVLLAFAMLSYIPFLGHHDRKFRGIIHFGKWFFLASLALGPLLGWYFLDDPRLVFDLLLFDQLCYLLLSHFVVDPEEARAVRAFIADWRKMA
jgi:CDP-diacylglycerol--serine O-phosphatidyltransferase